VIEINHIVFDIGKVLIAYDTEIPYLRLIPDEAERRHFLAEVCSPAWNIEQDRGRTWEEAEAELIALHPAKAPLIRAFRQNWHHMVGPAMEDVVAIMRRFIAAGHDVTMLTNFASDTYRESLKRFTFLNEPRGVTVSGDARLIKPDPAIYHLHEKTFDLDPSKTLFIDDSLPNILAAHSCGWHGAHFTGAAALEEELRGFRFVKAG
jgi:2-haloacid dehalogenase